MADDTKGTDGLTDDERRVKKFGLNDDQKRDAPNRNEHHAEMERANAAAYQALNITGLREEIGKRNERREQQGMPALPVTGSKADLVARLVEDDGADPRNDRPGDDNSTPAPSGAE